MEQLGSAVLVLTTDNRPLDRGLSVAERNVDTSARRMRTTVDHHLAAAGQSMSRTGSSLSRSLTVPIVGLGVATADAAVKFQQSMEMIHTQAGATQGEVNRLTGSVLKLAQSGQAAQGPKQLADALFHLESVGLRGAKAMDALKVASQGAAVGNANLEDTATALGAAWLVNIKGAGDLHHVMGVLNATVGAGNVRFGQLVEALGTGVLAASKQAGLSLQDVMGALAVFTDEGYAASSAAAQFSTALHFLTDPTSKASAALQDIGLKSSQLALDMHKPQGLLVALRDLQTHLDSTFPKGSGHALTIDQENQALGQYRQTLESTGLSGKKLADAVDKYKQKLGQFGSAAVAQEQTLGAIFPGGRGRVLEVLLNQLDRYNMKLGQINRTSGQFSQDVAATQQTAAFKIHAAWSQVQADAIKFGDVILPKLLKAGDTILKDGEKVANAFFKLPKGAQDAILTGGLIAAGLGPALKVLGLFSTVIGKAWALAGFIGRLSGFAHGAGSAIDRVGLASQSVGTMEVGTLIAKNMVGGPGGAAGAEGAVARGAEGAGAADAPAAARAARVTTTVAGVSVAGISGFAAMSHAQGGALNQLNALAHGVDPTAVLHLVGLPSLSDLLPKVKQRMNLTPAQIAAIGMGLDPASFGRITAGGLLHLGAFGAHGQATPTSLGAVGGPTANASPARSERDFMAMVDAIAKLDSHKQGVTQTAAALDHLAASAAKAGDVRWKFGDRLGAEMLRARNIESLGVKKLIGELDTLPPAARADAAQSMVFMAQSFESQGRLPLGSTVKLVGQLLANYQSVRDKGGQYFHSLMDDAGQVMDRLRVKIRTSTGQQRSDALAAYNHLRTQAVTTFSHLESDLAAKQDRMTSKIRSGTGDAAHAAGVNFAHFQTAVGDAMSSGVISASQGSKLIAQALNDTLKAFGAKQIAGITSVTASSIAASVSQAAGNILGVVGAHATGGKVTTPTVIVGEEAPRHPEFVLATNPAYRERNMGLWMQAGQALGIRGFAQGGVVTASQFGGPGDPGTGSTGYRGDNLYQHPDSFAELNMGTALGGLPYLTPITVGYHGKSMSLRKRDIGAGGAGLNGHTRAIDVWFQAANALGLPGLADVMWALGAHGSLSAAGGQIATPKVSGRGAIADMVRAGLGKVAAAANAYLTAHTATLGIGAPQGLPGGRVAGGGKGAYSAVLPVGRTDEGLDFTGAGPFGAVLDGTVIRDTLWPGWPGSGGLVYSTARGNIYAMEHVSPLVRAGQHVKAGQVIGDVLPGYPWLETGWANSAGTGPLTPYNGAPDGTAMPGGINFRHFLGYRQGGIVGLYNGGTIGHVASLKAAKAPKRKIAKVRQPHLARVPRLKAPKGFASSALDELQSLQTSTEDLGNWYGYLTQLYGDPSSAQPIITTTSADGTSTDHVNWGSNDPLTALTAMTGLPDPSTGHPTKGIYDWLRDIGTPPGADSALTAPMTFLGVDVRQLSQYNRMLADAQAVSGDLGTWSKRENALLGIDNAAVRWLDHALDPKFPAEKMTVPKLAQVLAGQVTAGSYRMLGFGSSAANSSGLFALGARVPITVSQAAYVQRRVAEYKDQLAKIEWLTRRKEQLPAERSAREAKLTERFIRERARLKVNAATGTFDASAWLSGAKRALGDEQAAALGQVTHRPPAGWNGTKAGWASQRDSELAQIRAEFASRRSALEGTAARHRFEGRVSSTLAGAGLSIEETAERAALHQAFSKRSRDYANQLRQANATKSADRSYLVSTRTQLRNQGTGISTALGTGLPVTLSDFTDAMGTFNTGRLELANITIPGLLQQISDLSGTTLAPNANAAAGVAGADNTLLLSLLEQQNAQLAEGLAVSQAQYKVLADLPPFAGTFHTGGVIPGPTGQERMALVKAGERVSPIGGETPDTHLHFSGRDAWLKDLIDVRVEHKLRAASRAAGRRLPSQGGGFMPGARS